MEVAVNDRKILYLDIETDRKGKNLYEIGVLCGTRGYSSSSPQMISTFIRHCSHAEYLCGHNLFDHDLSYINQHSKLFHDLSRFRIIDTLPLSLLFFSEKTHHALPKVYKSEDDFVNDPIKDCELTRHLMEKLVTRWSDMPQPLQHILFTLLRKQERFTGFFDYLANKISFEILDTEQLVAMIADEYDRSISDYTYLEEMIAESPVELAYILALLTPHIEIKAHPPKVLYDYPEIVEKQRRLCYNIDSLKNELSVISEEIFGFSEFRIFPKLNPSLLSTNTISQRDIIEAALRRDSFLAVLPTGGGKTFTFWLPAVIQASSYKALTVVISPLQALIEDHIKSFENKAANYRAVAISGFMTPQERSEAIEQVANGVADILYIAPESLRSNTIFSLLKNRYIERFVVDEAHCLSTWGNDFRQDYFYICEFIKDLLAAKSFQERIPVSCFTATAKPSVIDDIKNYFQEGLGLEMEEFLAKPERNNLHYRALEAPRIKKYTVLLRLIQEHRGSSLVYIPTSTRQCDEVAEKLAMDTGKAVRSFHSKLDSQEKMKILKDYIENEIDVIVATTAFGMGVDKPDITQVIHFEPSDSLENYAQEAGRGARDQHLEAVCPVLYDEADLDKHFQTLRRSKITVAEINSIFRVIKHHKGDIVLLSAKELAKEAGWDVEDIEADVESKIKTILLELEREGYIRRKRNKVRFYGDSVAVESRDKLYAFIERNHKSDEERWKYIEILNRLLGQGKERSIEIDDIARVLGIPREDVALILQELKEEGIIGDSRDMAVKLLHEDLRALDRVLRIEKALLEFLRAYPGDIVAIKELNEALIEQGILCDNDNESELIRELIKGWRSRGLFSFTRMNRQQDRWMYSFLDAERFSSLLSKRQNLVRELMVWLLGRTTGEGNIGFSLLELKKALKERYKLKELDRGLLFLHRHKFIMLLGGRFIYYNPLVIEKQEKIKITNKRYTKVEYKQRLGTHYQIKTEAIHIMGEYANLLLNDPKKAGNFLQDYFTLRYDAFKRRYKLFKETLSRPITKRRYEQIFKKLSPEQQAIIADQTSRAIMILAGPGSGKTRVLVHKIASLVLTEDVKPENFMMLTFSRSAVREFRSRLHKLIGDTAYNMEISTFHAYALKLIGRTAENNRRVLDGSIAEAARQIRAGQLNLPHLKALVLDEYQDINEAAFDLISAIAEMSPDMRVIAVGDDDQCIMEYAGADVGFFERFEERFDTMEVEEDERSFTRYELLTNYRSNASVVNYAEAFISKVRRRFKERPLIPYRKEGKKVEVIDYRGTSLVQPAMEWALKYLEESDEVAILAYTNDEVMRLYSLLRAKGVAARYLIDRPRFEVKMIEEVAVFDRILNESVISGREYKKVDFERAMEHVETLYAGSKNLPLLRKVVYGFLNESESLAASFWLEYLDELELEPLESEQGHVTISTIHKSKGLEFSSVVLLAQNPVQNDIYRRLHYVGMTRAKDHLCILHRDDRSFLLPGHAHYRTMDALPEEQCTSLIMVMGLSDIYLGFKGAQNRRHDLRIIAGEELLFRRSSYGIYQMYYKGHIVGQVSKKFNEKLVELETKGYRISRVVVDYVVCWLDRKEGREVRHVLGWVEMTSGKPF
ncbi:ATP-dependent DNA helicase RecQ [Hydrogenimonas sp.]|nr:ATP-dependent DNA helicase RecQ [Hydrogenimonas sp.]